MSDRVEYQGDGVALVDDKGRVAIPNSLRSILAKNAPRPDGKEGGAVIVGAHPKQRCLVAYDSGFLPLLRARLEAREVAAAQPGAEPDYNIKRRGASGESVPFDGSGRFIMPAFPRHYARIAEHAFFYGSIDWIEIWNPRLLLDTEGVDDVLKESCEFHCASKGIAL